ncbi:MAG: zinc-dependent metalloprotease [Bifidobacterium sp.]|nr:zinc-dependent metalloprotease [Bifidobacterium sp.]
MDENELHQWFLSCFGPAQGEMAWRQFSELPEQIRQQMLSQDASQLPDPAQMQSLMQAFMGGGLGSFSGMQQSMDEGPINVKLARSIALQQANAGDGAHMVTAQESAGMRRAMSEANLWLDTTTEFNPAPGEASALTRAAWVEGTIDAWARFAASVAASMNEALTAVISERLGDAFDGEITGMFAGPVPIPIPENMKDPRQLMKLFAQTSYAMQLGQAAGAMSREVLGSFDQGVALLDNPAGGMIMENVEAYAKSLDLPAQEVTEFLALREQAHARLFAAVPWLMARFSALIGKYARGIDIDLDAMEEQLRDASALDPDSLAGAVNLTNVGITDSPEQLEAMRSIENLLALVEGWVDTVLWRAGMAHLPHLEQLREMTRRERAIGGPAEITFENLLGLQLRPKRIREAAALWERITNEQGTEARDAMWSHPDLLPELPAEEGDGPESALEDATAKRTEHIDWDAELSKLLDDDANAGDDKPADGTDKPADGEQPTDTAQD